MGTVGCCRVPHSGEERVRKAQKEKSEAVLKELKARKMEAKGLEPLASR